MKKRFKAALAVVMVVLLGSTTAGFAEARGGSHGGRGGGFHGGGGGGFHGGGFHGGGFHRRGFHGGGFHGHPGFHGHGHPGFHRGFHGHGFVGVAPFVWWGPAYAYAPYAGPPASGYWYYCPSAQAYYPYVQTCPESWVPVPAS
jgi:hypothetical protein